MGAQSAGSAPATAAPTVPVLRGSGRPVGRVRSPAEVIAIARRVPELRAALARHPGTSPRVFLREPRNWQVSFFAPSPARTTTDEREVAQALIADRTGRVLETWTGYQVRWPMARGVPGAFGRVATAVWIWVPLSLLFLLPFLRPPWRLLHLDLLVLLALSVSVACFNRGNIRASVPLAYPPLLYLLVRLLALARAGPGRTAAVRLRPLLSPGALAIGAVFLLGFRLGLQVASSNVIDVGYAGVIGADRITHGGPLYGAFPADNAHGDTYGPLAYLAYLPFELLWPWHGTWDALPAAHVAATVFDVACVALLAGLGHRQGGRPRAALLAYLWLACPFTLLAVNSGANDPLVGALVLAALVAAGRPTTRGVAVAAAALVKFAPLALLPLLATHPPRRPARTLLATAATVGAGLLLVLALDGGLGTFADRTIGFQAGRASPFSVWGLYDLPGLQRVAELAAVLLALAVAVVPRRRDATTLAALTAAVLLGVQLTATHWFYLYLVWMIGPLLLALLGPYADDGAGRSTGSIDAARRSPSDRMTTALSQGSSVALS